MSQRIAIAWAAGLFEGEGCITSNRNGPYRYTRLQLSTTDLDVLERFRAVVGCGTIKSYAPRSGRENHKTSHLWTISDVVEVERIIDLFLPFFGSRRAARAITALEETAGSRGRRSAAAKRVWASHTPEQRKARLQPMHTARMQPIGD